MKKFMDIQAIRYDDIQLEGGKVRYNNISDFQVGDEINITEKVDGSNASIRLNETGDKFLAFSRNLPLDENNTLSGFWNYAQKLDVNMLKGRNQIIFGEWMGNGDRMNKILYTSTRGKWIVFDIYDINTEHYLSSEEVKEFCKNNGLEYVTEFYHGPFISWEHVQSFLHKNSYGNTQEGVVVRNESSKIRNLGREHSSRPYVVKIVNTEFAESMGLKKKEYKIVTEEMKAAKERELNLMKSIVTDNRIDKVMGKAIIDGELPQNLEPKDMSMVLKCVSRKVWEDIVKEENEIVESIGKNAGKLMGKIVAERLKKVLIG